MKYFIIILALVSCTTEVIEPAARTASIESVNDIPHITVFNHAAAQVSFKYANNCCDLTFPAWETRASYVTRISDSTYVVKNVQTTVVIRADSTVLDLLWTGNMLYRNGQLRRADITYH